MYSKVTSYERHLNHSLVLLLALRVDGSVERGAVERPRKLLHLRIRRHFILGVKDSLLRRISRGVWCECGQLARCLLRSGRSGRSVSV